MSHSTHVGFSCPLTTFTPCDCRPVRLLAVRVPPEAAGAPWIRLLCSGELVALGHLEPLGRGVLALVKPKIVLQD